MADTDPAGLGRFVRAQAPLYTQVVKELAAGRKEAHRMRFIFPQLRGLGHSAMARCFGLDSAQEAAAYVGHSTLGPRLLDCTRLVLETQDRSAQEIFGTPDDLKF